MDIKELLIDFRITSCCHLGCDLCFRNPGIEDKPLKTIKQIITKMSQIGFKRLGITGGEPTVRDDYLAIIMHAKNLGFLTYLSTTGHRFIEHLVKLNPILDWVGLPIDGIDYKTNCNIRSASMGLQHKTIQHIFNSLAQNFTTIKIKLTTVVSKANINQLSNIVNYVNKLPFKYNVWRFYQFCPLGIGKEQRNKLEITEKEFNINVQTLKKQYPNSPISGATFKERDKANIIMEPNFDVIIPNGENYSYLCNMQKDPNDAIINSILQQQNILVKCLANRYWITEIR
jgi:MoaA/NifB/PqqE/SkfB family radical SAM enzyme